MAYELIKVSELPELTTPADANVVPIQDGDYLKRISFENFKEAITGNLDGKLLSEGTKNAILNCFQHVAWKDAEGETAYNDLEAILSGSMLAVINNLTNCETSNTASLAARGSSYTATITSYSAYVLQAADVVVTMGGEDITATAYNNGVVNIPAVTGEIVITATVAADYTFFDYIAQTAGFAANKAIITDIALSTDDTFITQIYHTQGSWTNFNPLFGVRRGSSTKQFGAFVKPSTSQVGYWYSGIDTVTQITGLTPNVLHEYTVLPVGKSEEYPDNVVIKIDGTEYNTTSTATGVTFSAWLAFFGYATSASASAVLANIELHFSETIIKDANDEIIYDLIPAQKDGNYGFYEFVNDKFYYSSAQECFTCGNW